MKSLSFALMTAVLSLSLVACVESEDELRDSQCVGAKCDDGALAIDEPFCKNERNSCMVQGYDVGESCDQGFDACLVCAGFDDCGFSCLGSYGRCTEEGGAHEDCAQLVTGCSSTCWTDYQSCRNAPIPGTVAECLGTFGTCIAAADAPDELAIDEPFCQNEKNSCLVQGYDVGESCDRGYDACLSCAAHDDCGFACLGSYGRCAEEGGDYADCARLVTGCATSCWSDFQDCRNGPIPGTVGECLPGFIACL